MSEQVEQKKEKTRSNRRTDGSGKPPKVVKIPTMPKAANVNTPGAPNAALKEAPPKPEDGVDPNHPHAAHVRIVDREKAIVLSDRRKIAICGFASSTRGMIPIDDPSWEIWGMNQLYRHIPRADRWFDMHWNWNTELVPGTDHEGWIRNCGIPVYMIEAHPDLPTTVRYPIHQLIAEYTDYFTSSVAEMLALAIWEIDQKVAARLDAEWQAGDVQVHPNLPTLWMKRRTELYAEYTIGLFGIDLVVGEEYEWQKACAEFWIGVAALGRGISVVIPPQSALCKQLFRYGYETEPTAVVKPSEIKAHGQSLAKQREELLRQLYLVDGALQADEHWHELVNLRLRGADIKLG